MMNCTQEVRARGILMAFLLLLAGTSMLARDRGVNTKIKVAITQVRTANSSEERVQAAERLAELMTEINPQEVEDKTAADIVALLSDPDYDVCSWITVAIGQLGRKAKLGDSELNNKLEEAMDRVRNARSPDARYHAAEDLSTLMHGINPMLADDKTVADMILLLDDPDGAVRMWVAGDLGIFGPRAKKAVPKLLALLPAADCEEGDVTSAGAIRLALKRLRIEPPPFDPKKCK